MFPSGNLHIPWESCPGDVCDPKVTAADDPGGGVSVSVCVCADQGHRKGIKGG